MNILTHADYQHVDVNTMPSYMCLVPWFPYSLSFMPCSFACFPALCTCRYWSLSQLIWGIGDVQSQKTTESGCVKRSRSTSADTQHSKDQLIEPVSFWPWKAVTAPQLHVRPLSPFKCAKCNYIILDIDYSFILISMKLLYQHLGTPRTENGSKKKRKVHLKRCGNYCLHCYLHSKDLKICGVQLSECIHLVKRILINSTSQHWQWVSVLRLHHGY